MTKLTNNVGQGELFEAEVAHTSAAFLSNEAKKSFGWAIGALNPIFANEKFGQLSEEDLSVVQPAALEKSLYGDGIYSIGGLAVNEHEYQLIPRSARAISAKVAATTTRARLIDPKADRRNAAADRSVGHTLIGYADRDGLMKWLGNEAEKLTEARREMNQPGFRHHLDGADWLMLLKGVIDVSFENIVHVVGLRSKWNTQQQTTSRQAMLYNLSKTPQQKRIGYWRDMTDLAIEYNRKKQLVFKSKIRTAKSIGEQALERGART